MASYGSGFAQGMYAGSTVAQRGMETYERRQDEALQDKIMALATARGELDEEGNQRSSIVDMVGQASIGDIQSQLVDMYVTQNGKIDSKAYGFINNLSQGLFGIKEKEKEFQQKETLFGLQTRKAEAQIADYYDKMNKRVEGGGGGYGKPTSMQKNYAWLRENDPEAADAYLTRQTKGSTKPKEEKLIDGSKLQKAKDFLTDNVTNFDNLPEDEQNNQAKLFAKKGEIPTVKEKRSGGHSIFGKKIFEDKEYSVGGGEEKEEKKQSGKKTGSAAYHY